MEKNFIRLEHLPERLFSVSLKVLSECLVAENVRGVLSW